MAIVSIKFVDGSGTIFEADAKTVVSDGVTAVVFKDLPPGLHLELSEIEQFIIDNVGDK